jgi:hypothetical protein
MFWMISFHSGYMNLIVIKDSEYIFYWLIHKIISNFCVFVLIYMKVWLEMCYFKVIYFIIEYINEHSIVANSIQKWMPLWGSERN